MTSSQNNENVITPVTVSQLSQTPLDELILPPVLVPRLEMDTKKPSTTTNVPLRLDSSPKLKSTDKKTGPLSLEMFNCAASDLNDKGVINLKKYSKYLNKKPKQI